MSFAVTKALGRLSNKAMQEDTDIPTVDLRLVTSSRDPTLWEFGRDRGQAARTVFGLSPVQNLDLPLRTPCAATELAYQWLARDLAAVGWLKDGRHHLA